MLLRRLFSDKLMIRTFVASYQQSLKVQEQLSQNRIRFATRLNEMCDEMLGLAREGERQRKMVSSSIADQAAS